MNRYTRKVSALSRAVLSLALGAGATLAMATEPCDDFDECKVLIEINSTDGDIGFHFLMDGDGLNAARIDDPNGVKVFEDKAKGPLLEQKLTETFAESAEPLCWDDPDADEEDLEDVFYLEDFLERWTPGIYLFTGKGDEGEASEGESELTFDLPAAPKDLDFDGSVISWSAGNDLGNCADYDTLDDLVSDGILPTHPEAVEVDSWEVVLEPDVDDGDPLGSLKFAIRIAGDTGLMEVTVPAEYLAYFESDTPGKIEVGAIGGEDNATFSEVEICINEDQGCDD